MLPVQARLRECIAQIEATHRTWPCRAPQLSTITTRHPLFLDQSCSASDAALPSDMVASLFGLCWDGHRHRQCREVIRRNTAWGSSSLVMLGARNIERLFKTSTSRALPSATDRNSDTVARPVPSQAETDIRTAIEVSLQKACAWLGSWGGDLPEFRGLGAASQLSNLVAWRRPQCVSCLLRSSLTVSVMRFPNRRPNFAFSPGVRDTTKSLLEAAQ